MKRSDEVVCEEHDKNDPDRKNKTFSLKTPKCTFWLSSKNKGTLNNTKAAALWSDIWFQWYQL